MNRSQLLKRFEATWNDLLTSYAGLSDSEMMEPGVTGNWSIRDIIAHVTTWENESLIHVPHMLAGKRPPRYSVTYGGVDAFNALITEQKKHISLRDVLQQRDETHRKLFTFLKTIPEEQLILETSVRRRLRLDTWGHYRMHTQAILAWREHRSISSR